MLALGRALMSRPKLILLDEPSLGLAPLLIKEVFRVICQINQEGTTILLIEQNAMAALNIADGASTEIGGMLQRQRELALQASNDTLTSDQRTSLNTEYQQLNQEITRIAAGTQYNTQGLTAGTGLGGGAAQVQVGPNAGDQLTLPQINMTGAALGVTGTSVTSQQAAQAALTTIDNAIGTLNTQRSNVGAIVNRMESAQNNLSVAAVNTQAAESVLRDQDMAEGVTALTTQQLLMESGTRAFARFQEISANHLLGLLK
jgi:flagellin